MNLFDIPHGAAFLDALAAEWLRMAGPDPLARAHGVVLLPTRRAARALAEAFLRVGKGQPMLLPRILALGALDEAPLALDGALDVPPAADPALRLAHLSRLILAMGGAGGAPRHVDGAWRLARELARLMDEAEWAGISLAERLPDAADPAFAAHWQQTLHFLAIVTEAWPHWLADQGLVNPVAHQVKVLEAQAEAWRRAQPAFPVWVAAPTGGIPAVEGLVRAVADLPNGRVILSGLDRDLSDESWTGLTPTHPQFGTAKLLAGIGARRDDVRPWPDAPSAVCPPGRVEVFARALLPAEALGEWRVRHAPDLSGLMVLRPADQSEEAAAIAIVLREALERPGATAALITPDRDLAGRVTAELARFGVIADDSAGEKLAETPQAVFLRLLARALADDLAPVALLALLKHPLAAAGMAPASCRAAARALERAVLRGPAPGGGLTGLRQRLAQVTEGGEGMGAFLGALEKALEPALRLRAGRGRAASVAPDELLAGLVEAAERLAATDEEPGPARLWAGEEGAALAERLAAALPGLAILPGQGFAVLPGLLDALLEDAAIRSRRALRGRTGAEHPRIFIWGLLEARLQSVDTAVLAGLVEGVWPPAVEPGPWLSRPMRARVGLPSPEEAVGAAARDFVAAACAARVAVLSCPRRRDGAPAVPARWLARLDAYLNAQGTRLPAHPAAAWARGLDQPAGQAQPIAPPRPAPALRHRPRRMSVTEVETWLRDPFAIYARHVLRLRPLDPLEQVVDVADYGRLVHAGLHDFYSRGGDPRAPGALEELTNALHARLRQAALRESLLTWWTPQLARIAAFVIETERARPAPSGLWVETSGVWHLADLDFTLRGRADRIERDSAGGLTIIDYKTGTVPSDPEVRAGLAPQLPLEAAMAAAGAFPGVPDARVVGLEYWRLTGRRESGAVFAAGGRKADVAELVADSACGLRRLIAAFDDPAQPYLAQPIPGIRPRFSDYAQLARVGEFSAGTDEE